MDQDRQQFSVREDFAPVDGEVASGPPKTLATIDPAPPTAAPRPVSRERLINKLNYLNFQNKIVLLAFEHARYGHTLRVEARPHPCRENRLRCTWVDPRAARTISRYYVFSALLIPDEQKLLQGIGRVTSMDEEGIVIELPEVCTEVHARRVVRYPCKGIQVQLFKDGSRFEGTLIDFTPISFRVRVRTSPPQTFGWLTAGAPVMVVLSNDREILFSGDCRIVSKTGGRISREYVLEPTQDRIQRFERQQHRSVRQEFVPTPTVAFEHPLTGRLISLKVLDLSASGLAVEENARNAVLMPGLMIPRLDLCLASSFRFSCRAQVVHRQVLDPESENSCLRCGLALLDMDVADHVQLVALLHHADNRQSYVCNQVDMDDLWSFFFETGFIYPQKYGFIQKNREQIKQTYEKLYTRSPSIARHFIYQDRGKILGHMAMLRFYDSTWLIHHHAARSNSSFRAGLNVLEQITRFVNESCRFSFMHMEYLICFYRPENRFPRSVFGGLCRGIDDPRICSEATFAYLHWQCDHDVKGRPGEYSLSPVDDDDLIELSSFYQHESGGLMIGALDLEPGDVEHSDLSEEFRKLELKRERQLFAIKADDRLQAMAMVNLADIGLNLSDLTNSITLFVLDQRELTNETIYDALSVLMKRFGQQEIPVLIYPEAAAKSLKIPVEKHYVMWSLMPHYPDSFYRSMNVILRAGPRNGGTNDKRRSPPV
ncbi:MAG: PilZ domain-containing protein [Polyangia bacterium]|jgi:hypothetical protein